MSDCLLIRLALPPQGALGPDTPPLRESRSLTYFTDETLQEKVERHLHDIVEADLIHRLQASPSILNQTLCSHDDTLSQLHLDWTHIKVHPSQKGPISIPPALRNAHATNDCGPFPAAAC